MPSFKKSVNPNDWQEVPTYNRKIRARHKERQWQWHREDILFQLLFSLEHGFTVTELSKATNLSRPTIMKHIKALDEEGLAKREKGKWKSNIKLIELIKYLNNMSPLTEIINSATSYKNDSLKSMNYGNSETEILTIYDINSNTVFKKGGLVNMMNDRGVLTNSVLYIFLKSMLAKDLDIKQFDNKSMLAFVINTKRLAKWLETKDGKMFLELVKRSLQDNEQLELCLVNTNRDISRFVPHTKLDRIWATI